MLTFHNVPVAPVKEKLTADPDSEIATTSLRVSLICPVTFKLKKMRRSRAAVDTRFVRDTRLRPPCSWARCASQCLVGPSPAPTCSASTLPSTCK